MPKPVMYRFLRSCVVAAALLGPAAASSPNSREATEAVLVNEVPNAAHDVWAATLKQRVSTMAAAPSGGCLVALAGSSLTVFAPSGEVLWVSEMSEESAMRPHLAISPTCDWIAIATPDEPPRVQFVERDGTRRTVALAPVSDDELAGSTAWHPESLAIAPDGSTLAVGTALGRLVMIDRAGTTTHRLLIDDSRRSILTEFTPDGSHLLVYGAYIAGLIDLEGRWSWQTTSFARVAADSRFTIFAALYEPMHGAPMALVSLLDSQGRSLWAQSAWEASVAIAPAGDFMAVAAVPAEAVQRTEAGFDWDDRGKEVWLVDATGKLTARRVLPSLMQFVTKSRCVVVLSSHTFIGLDVALNERWRFYAGAPFPLIKRLGDDLMVRASDYTIRATRLPGCTP